MFQSFILTGNQSDLKRKDNVKLNKRKEKHGEITRKLKEKHLFPCLMELRSSLKERTSVFLGVVVVVSEFFLLEVETKKFAAETASIKTGSGCLSVFMSSLKCCIVCFIPQKPNRGKGL